MAKQVKKNAPIKEAKKVNGRIEIIALEKGSLKTGQSYFVSKEMGEILTKKGFAKYA